MHNNIMILLVIGNCYANTMAARPRLYNLSLDRAETVNLATKHPDRVNNLAKALLEWNKSMPADNGPALGKEHKVQAKEKNSKN